MQRATLGYERLPGSISEFDSLRKIGGDMSTAIDFVRQMKVGISIGDTLDAFHTALPVDAPTEKSETAWGKPVITEELVDTILGTGFQLIRIPVTWSGHLYREDDYRIEPNWLARVKEVVDYAYRRGAFVILNLHHEDWNFPYYDNKETACSIMRLIWKQLADTFAEYDEHLIFEGQNEPRKIGTDLEWNGGDQEGWDVVNATNQVFVETVRSAGGNNAGRYLMIPGYAANCQVGIKHIAIPRDERIIISVHAYEPYDFALKIDGRATWNQDTKMIDTLMDDLKTLYVDRGIPVIIGEFGAMNKDNEEDRAEWVRYYLDKASEIHVPCVWWDNGNFSDKGERFGLINRYDYTVTYPKVVAELTK